MTDETGNLKTTLTPKINQAFEYYKTIHPGLTPEEKATAKNIITSLILSNRIKTMERIYQFTQLLKSQLN
jgi:hypothetical protein